MPVDPYLNRLARSDWLIGGPLGELVPAYIDVLRTQRYAKGTIGAYLRCLAHFNFWMTKQGVTVEQVNGQLLQLFLTEHLPVCSCPGPCRSVVHEIRAAFRRLEAVLPDRKPVSMDPIAIELAQFDQYLRQACGLSANTCFYRLRHTEDFLVRRFGRQTPDVSQLSVHDLEAFFIQLAARWKPGSCAVVRTDLRSYLRFKAMLGYDTQTLLASLPLLANWRQRKPPRILSSSQITAFESAFDRDDPVGMRDYAMARCLLDLGLRGDEAAYLSLDDFDWRNGVITLPRTKSRRAQRLPLPVNTGEAISHYLQAGRPKTSSRFLFVRHRAPFQVPLSVDAIRNAMNRAFHRCALSDRFCNTHVLRRSMATRLHTSGVSIKEIADVLRHRDLDTARVYARVDLDSLRSVALPWSRSEA